MTSMVLFRHQSPNLIVVARITTDAATTLTPSAIPPRLIHFPRSCLLILLLCSTKSSEKSSLGGTTTVLTSVALHPSRAWTPSSVPSRTLLVGRQWGWVVNLHRWKGIYSECRVLSRPILCFLLARLLRSTRLSAREQQAVSHKRAT